jgi:hypothetical protein
MGTRRTLEQYIPVSGVDTKRGRVIPGKHCVVEYQPWQSDAESSVYSEYKDGTGGSQAVNAKEGSTHPLFGSTSLHKKRKGKRLGRRAIRFAKQEH